MDLRSEHFLWHGALLLSLFFVSPQVGAENKSIHWVLLDFPPFMDVPNSQDGNVDIAKVTGPMADIQRELAKNLSDFQHSYQTVSFMRAQKLFESLGQYCTILFFKTPEREKYLYFGERLASTSPPGLVINENKKDLLVGALARGGVDLKKLLTTKFRLGVVQGRSFAGEIDKTIVGSDSPLFKLVMDQAVGRLFMMLNTNRLDGVLAYYLEFSSEKEKNPAASALKFYNLKLKSQVLELQVACEKSPWGKRMTDKLSALTKKESMQKRISVLLKQTRAPTQGEEKGELPNFLQ